MKLQDIKIGGVYRVTSDMCENYNEAGGAYIRVSAIDHDLHYDILNAGFKKQDTCFRCLEAKHLAPLDSIEGIKKGDIIIGTNGNERMVQEKLGDLVAVTQIGRFATHGLWLNIAELKDWKIKPPEPEKSIEELTVEEISKRLGYSVKII
jgi:hypothetical protein